MTEDRLTPPDLAEAVWHTSSYSGGNNECVEIAPNLPHLIPVRDSKRPTGPVLTFGHTAWQTFVNDLA
ncbi:regulatory protein [Streptomyces sp. CBMAI 2042]|uniref:DUF397 domain-containing protein n=1 Tax=Streptomyces sp. CBMAI 2042 TaxID=2305222 RepID=UPI000F297614|nr:DUF397 domain-containing protein [Streptomyces sp. CBMAI 2042]RLV66257.1 regulatory protein [Streptomyces sp. CBMAI 2042]